MSEETLIIGKWELKHRYPVDPFYYQIKWDQGMDE